MDHDALFKDMFYKVMNDCEKNEKSSYECAKIMFECKFKGITPTTLQIINEDKFLIKNNSTEDDNKTARYNKIKVIKYVDYSIINMISVIWATILDIKVLMKDSHYPVHVMGVNMVVSQFFR